jgi:sulfur-oxidizing protein SoxB
LSKDNKIWLSPPHISENEKKYVVSGWGSINENVEGPPIYDLLEKYITGEKSIKPQNSGSIKVIGMK